MADNEAPRPPTITPVPDSRTGAGAAPNVPRISLPAETVRRWQDIVRQALSSGRDISVLVQQYAEQSFNTKLGSLDTQGARKRMLTRAHAALERERVRAEAHLQAQPAVKPPIMTRSFQANSIEVPGPQEPPPSQPMVRSEKKIEIEWHHTTTQVADPYTKRAELEAHMQRLVGQMQAIDEEIPTIDAVLNKGLRNQQNVVNELAAVSRELYRLAQDVKIEPAAKRTPIDGSGFQKSGGKKDAAGPSAASTADTAAPEPQGPSQPVSAVDGPAGPKGPVKTVPINPLVPASKHLARVLGKASSKTSQAASKALTPVGTAVAKGAGTASHAVGSMLSKLLRAVSNTVAAVIQKIKDIWPWRGPPPA